MLETFTDERFRAHLGEPFAVTVEEGLQRTFTLLGVDALAGPPDAARRPFSLLFADPSPEPFDQRTVLVGHPELGEFPLFVVPVARDPEGGVQYEAVFT